jgi:demethylmenaquinone methyltransferase/2-methoxy-6-polyprenyl-1,4-benzoquinol methylase
MSRLFSPVEIARTYARRAKRYDRTTRVYDWVGAPLEKWRRKAIPELRLCPGDTVVDIGCGTGLNIPLLEQAVGPEGSVVGVDLTEAMLDQARQRVARHGWQNVTLIQGRAEAFEFPGNIDAVFSSYALTLMPEYDAVVRRGAEALRPGGRWVVLDFKLSGSWLDRLAPALAWFLVRPYAGTVEMARQRQPWKSMERYVGPVSMREFYGGFVYIGAATVGEE